MYLYIPKPLQYVISSPLDSETISSYCQCCHFW